ncbi:DUF1194 domain-containing protein [Aphanothece sacrum]|uniref:VWFA domain-containing protein n=1 Tax=Aphanothece sacrum FPU1 TaxID=1920663 RepID=A0A401IL28_APHSA|nr:DUF1194 domain-containing protein [Aphanothece sacrum]GBF81963.1 hypothetical protein AsFPU1_3386 [Aphanothece sacrum FPU1]GBF83592.1 hypothetical protein AsFPU3_0635 [Aphanothece sacrum FPU3]
MKNTNLISAVFIGSTCTLSVLGYGMSAKAAALKSVDIELAFLIDGSASISQSDFNAQINTLSKIFSATNFYDVFVKPLSTKKLAVSAYQFGTQGTLNTPVISQLADWVLIDEQNQKAGRAFSLDLSDGINTKLGNFTPIGDAVSFVTNALLKNQYDGKKVVNISTDGFNTHEIINPSDAAVNAFFREVTINAIVIPATQSDIGGKIPNPLYDLAKIKSIIDPYPNFPSEYKNKNFDGSPAFIITDYATGKMSLEDALLLKLGKETIGEKKIISVPPLIFDPPKTPVSDPSTSNTPDSETALNSDQTIPEPNAILGLLSLGILGLIKKIKCQ